MFGKGRYTPERKRRAKRKLERKKQELKLCQETVGIERETKLVTAQIGVIEAAEKKITNHQLKLVKSTSKKAITATIQGMNDQVEKQLPAMLESRQKAGRKMISSSSMLIQSVKDRAKS